ncbi:MAG: hypothetical protein QOH79_3109 [Acidimicrobiaceae bacterium]
MDSLTDVGPPVKNSFVREARVAAANWKATTSALPERARAGGCYRGGGESLPFCVPMDDRDHNLLAEARDLALGRFAAAEIPWHHGGDRPSNHLLSSQVQCANALAPFVEQPASLQRMFETVLDIGKVLPFGATTTCSFDATDHVVFEWIGTDNYLNEHVGSVGTRGANNTSADAAMRYLTPSGSVEIALIEWKYVEQYLGHELSGGDAKNAVRRARYDVLLADEDSPIRVDLVPFDDLLVEPFYQLMRLQLLAWQMERAQELEADCVRLVIAAPSANHPLMQSFNRPSLRALAGPGGTILDAWRAMLRRPDRFAYLDTATLISAGSPTSSDFKSRYGHLSSAVVPPLPPRA